MISASKVGQDATTVCVGMGVGEGTGVNVGVGSGVGVSGMISLVAARQARVESTRAAIQTNLI